jgi:hypothetical protein
MNLVNVLDHGPQIRLSCITIVTTFIDFGTASSNIVVVGHKVNGDNRKTQPTSARLHAGGFHFGSVLALHPGTFLSRKHSGLISRDIGLMTLNLNA